MISIVFLFGLAIGSFLNAYIWRLHISKDSPPDDRRTVLPTSVWRGRSCCPQCKKLLHWYELIPLLSFIIQRGRCRGCKEAIDWQYPAVELVTGLLFVLSVWNLEFVNWNLFSISDLGFRILPQWYLFSVLLILFVFDLCYGLVPDRVVLPAIVVAVLFTIAQNGFTFHILRSTFYAVFVGALFFAAQYYISRGRWLGSGDIRIGALMGAMLGWPLVFEGLVISYMLGGLVALLLLAAGKKKFGQTVPLGTFLTLGTVITFLYGNAVWQWYWNI